MPAPLLPGMATPGPMYGHVKLEKARVGIFYHFSILLPLLVGQFIFSFPLILYIARDEV